jgi:hypothetical protein
LISTEDFERAQALLAAKGKRAVVRRPRTGGHTYILRSLCHCDLCGRRMRGNWSNDAPYYRCRYPQEYALANKLDHPKSVQVREEDILEALDDWLAGVFSPPRLENTITLLERSQGADPGEDTTKIAARQILADCERKLQLHQAALEAGTDPKIVEQWPDEVLARQASANAQLAAIGDRPRRLTKKEISSMMHDLGDQVGGLRSPPQRERPRSTAISASNSRTSPRNASSAPRCLSTRIAWANVSEGARTKRTCLRPQQVVPAPRQMIDDGEATRHPRGHRTGRRQEKGVEVDGDGVGAGEGKFRTLASL